MKPCIVNDENVIIYNKFPRTTYTYCIALSILISRTTHGVSNNLASQADSRAGEVHAQ